MLASENKMCYSGHGPSAATYEMHIIKIVIYLLMFNLQLIHMIGCILAGIMIYQSL